MFEEATLTAVSPGSDPAMPDDVGWHPDRGDWVWPEQCDPAAAIDAALLRELCTGEPGPTLGDAGRVPAGPELAALLAGHDPAAADAYDVVEAVAGWGRLAAWVAAGQAAALAELASRAVMAPGETGYRSVNPVTNTAVEVAARTQLSTKQAENQVGQAVQLVADFPGTHAALSAGLIDVRRARVVTDELGGQEPAVRARVEAAVLPKAPFLDSVALRRLVKRLLHELAPMETAERARAARDGRYVAVMPASDGMAFLEALLPAEDATALNTALTSAAADAKRADVAADAPMRTMDQRRADALAELGWAALTTCADAATTTGEAATDTTVTGEAATDTTPTGQAPTNTTVTRASVTGEAVTDATVTRATATAQAAGLPPRRGPGTARRSRRPVTVHVTIPFGSLAGVNDQPGDLDGYGPVPAHVARALAAEGVWTWLSTDPGTGQLLDLGRTRYRPSKTLAEFIVARDRTCRMPGCHRLARSADIDHIVPFAAGGSTCPAGCHALCETHHLLKHHGGWDVERQPDGSTLWRSPTGHDYTRPPDSIRPGATPDPPPR